MLSSCLGMSQTISPMLGMFSRVQFFDVAAVAVAVAVACCSALLKLMGLLFHGTSFFLKLPLPTPQLMTLACLLFSST